MAGRHKELKHMEIEILDDTQENTQNGNSNCSQDVQSQTISEKEPWGRLFKKRILRRKVDPGKQKIVIGKEDERDYFDVRGMQFRLGRDPQCEYVILKNDGIDLKSWSRISKVHFVISRDIHNEDGPVTIKDLSRNGTFVNGQLIGQNQVSLLRTGDVISIIVPDLKLFDFKDITLRKRIDLPNEIQRQYFVERKIGSGAFGEVYKVLDRKLNPYAVKFIKGFSGSDEKNQSSDNEIKIMMKLKHVCIIRTIDIQKIGFGGVSLILEYMGGGDLLNRIINSRLRRLTEDQSRCFMFQITDAIHYLHSRNITHRDMKPDNILLKDSEDMTLVKITDFGLSKIVTEGTCMKSLLGTPNYVAPEVLQPSVTKYTSKVDVWSMGVMLFAMLSGTLPFAEDYGDVDQQIMNGTYEFIASCWKQTSRDAIRLIRKMLIVQPEKRIGIPDIFETNWMDPKYEGIIRAKQIMESHGATFTHMSHGNTGQIRKEIEFVQPRLPTKRARLHI